VLASLGDHSKWADSLGAAWPIREVGPGRKTRGGNRGDGGKVVSEREVVEAYASARGVLSPPYASAGSGYWRVRYNYAAAVGAIIYCGLDDGEAIGPSFTNDIRDIETATDAELDDLAGRQRAQLQSWEMPRDEVLQTLDKVFQNGYRSS
jgi:hypothetical protein